MSSGRLLLVLPLEMYIVGGRIFTDTQACNGLRLWLENFDYVTLAAPTETRPSVPPTASAIDETLGAERLTIVPLPHVYRPHRFAAVLPETIKLLKSHIRAANYLHFAIGGIFGDWGAVACILAQRSRLPYAVWTDRVESRVVEFQSLSKKGVRRFYALAIAKAMARYERFVIGRSALGLFHGMDCYGAYAKYCSNPHVVHDIHLAASARISDQELDERLSKPHTSLKLVYAGRVHLDKGVFDWIEALSIAAQKQCDFAAIWFGAGPEFEFARARVDQLGLSAKISFPGPLASSQLLGELRGSDAFVFCHKTPESPRCLIEALICGLPIVGYDSSYPRDLIRNGGGILTSLNDPGGVAELHNEASK